MRTPGTNRSLSILQELKKPGQYTVTIIIGVIVCYYYAKHTVAAAVKFGVSKYCRNII